MAPIEPGTVAAQKLHQEVVRADKHRLINELEHQKVLPQNQNKTKEIVEAQQRLFTMSVEKKPEKLEKVIERAEKKNLIKPKSIRRNSFIKKKMYWIPLIIIMLIVGIFFTYKYFF